MNPKRYLESLKIVAKIAELQAILDGDPEERRPGEEGRPEASSEGSPRQNAELRVHFAIEKDRGF